MMIAHTAKATVGAFCLALVDVYIDIEDQAGCHQGMHHALEDVK